MIKGRQIPVVARFARLLDVRCDELKEFAREARKAGLNDVATKIEDVQTKMVALSVELDAQGREAFVAARRGELPE